MAVDDDPAREVERVGRVADDFRPWLWLRDELQLGYAHLRFLSILIAEIRVEGQRARRSVDALRLAHFFVCVDLCLCRSAHGRERLSSCTLGGDYEMKSGGCGEVFTRKVISARLAVTVTVPFAVADEEINNVFSTRFAIGDAVLSVESCSLHKQSSGLRA